MPSSSLCGSLSISARSMKAPGSPSSALQIRYFWSLDWLSAIFHLRPVRKPPPPRPRSPLFSTMSHTTSRVLLRMVSRKVLYPPRAMYSSMLPGSTMPENSSTQRNCGLKKECWSTQGKSDHGSDGPALNCPTRFAVGTLPANTPSRMPATLSGETCMNDRRRLPGICTSSIGSNAHMPMQPTSTISTSLWLASRYSRTAFSTLATPAPIPQVPMPR